MNAFYEQDVAKSEQMDIQHERTSLEKSSSFWPNFQNCVDVGLKSRARAQQPGTSRTTTFSINVVHVPALATNMAVSQLIVSCCGRGAVNTHHERIHTSCEQKMSSHERIFSRLDKYLLAAN
jgi:hypothetical protein